MKAINWDLEQILPIKEFDSATLKVQEKLKLFEKLVSKLSPEITTTDFDTDITAYEVLLEQLMRLYTRVMLQEEVAHDDSQAKLLMSKVKLLLLEFDEATRQFWLWIKGKELKGIPALDDRNATRLFKAVPRVSYLFVRQRQLAQHSLSNESESIIVNKDINGLETLLEVRSLIDTGHDFQITVKGKRKVFKTTADLLLLTQSPLAEEREKAYRALLGYYKKHRRKYFAIYEAVVRNWNYEVKLRHYDSAINQRNVQNDIPDSVVESLLQVCKQNAPIFQKLFKLKAKLLGVKKLKRFDMFAPVLRNSEKKRYTYEQAQSIVMDVLQDFDPEFRKYAQAIITKNHIDVYPDQHKTGGAFCINIANTIDPYVMLNFTSTKRDVLTLAHELGHAVHQKMSSGQSLLAADAPLTLAETASTFNEALTFEKLYKETNAKDEKISMLFERLLDNYSTIVRQSFLVLFELTAHELIPKGVSLETLLQKYKENLDQQYGEAVEIDPIFQYEWLYIPHLVNTPFYCYAYSFGELLALALLEQYRKLGKPFITKIRNILQAGGSRNGMELLLEQGIDIFKPEFWQQSFDYINTEIGELEKLIG